MMGLFRRRPSRASLVKKISGLEIDQVDLMKDRWDAVETQHRVIAELKQARADRETEQKAFAEAFKSIAERTKDHEETITLALTTIESLRDQNQVLIGENQGLLRDQDQLTDQLTTLRVDLVDTAADVTTLAVTLATIDRALTRGAIIPQVGRNTGRSSIDTDALVECREALGSVEHYLTEEITGLEDRISEHLQQITPEAVAERLEQLLEEDKE